ncbi:MAG TPA: exo-alpha-sialidase, partial [Thermoanaerobaculia bacterium]|nr:exo-alpha-sialidase [Thermoanaerobaculia bacterium]
MQRLLFALVFFSASALASPMTSVPSPAGAGSGEPFLYAARDGSVLLSWLEAVEGTRRTALRFARWRGGKWSAPRTIVEREDLFVNWADFPSLVEDAKGTLFAHWLQKSGAGTYSYDIRMALSKDGGATWGTPFLLNRDGIEGEHGFVSLAPLPHGGIGAAWLDGRKMTGGDHGHAGGDMTLRYATLDAAGRMTADEEIDARVCECCTTGMAMTSSGPVIVYRDRSAADIRDISMIRRTATGWSKPQSVRNDQWKINGCPVNGPQIDAIGNRTATAWFTMANNQSRVWATFSDGKAIAIDDGKPLGRVDVVLLDENTAVVTWLEQPASGTEIRARRITRPGQRSPSLKVADTANARS